MSQLTNDMLPVAIADVLDSYRRTYEAASENAARWRAQTPAGRETYAASRAEAMAMAHAARVLCLRCGYDVPAWCK